MAKLPKIRSCLITDFSQTAGDGKLNLIGFYGVAPQVAVQVPVIPTQINICAVMLCEKSDETGSAPLEAQVDGPIGILMKRTSIPEEVALVAGKSVFCAINLQGLPINEAGEYKISLFSDEQLHSVSTFQVSLKIDRPAN